MEFFFGNPPNQFFIFLFDNPLDKIFSPFCTRPGQMINGLPLKEKLSLNEGIQTCRNRILTQVTNDLEIMHVFLWEIWKWMQMVFTIDVSHKA